MSRILIAAIIEVLNAMQLYQGHDHDWECSSSSGSWDKPYKYNVISIVGSLSPVQVYVQFLVHQDFLCLIRNLIYVIPPIH